MLGIIWGEWTGETTVWNDAKEHIRNCQDEPHTTFKKKWGDQSFQLIVIPRVDQMRKKDTVAFFNGVERRREEEKKEAWGHHNFQLEEEQVYRKVPIGKPKRKTITGCQSVIFSEDRQKYMKS